MNRLERRFYLVDAQVLPEVFLKVIRAKELLASGQARNISAATRSVGLSRSAFYKYKDCIFDSENGRELITVMATLRDETGALQSLLAGISSAGASIVTINQATPENGTAQVAVTIRTDTMQMTPDELAAMLGRQSTVVGVRLGYDV
ncbi:MULTISPECIES: ACT domain-containing protein [unclassified Faecalibacterium]|uniref:ACT domain-containing protein n=1 Tax=unclassified Faecalibacterium TaxID=2646395 RepID=UPI000B39B71B|nr:MULTISPECIES: ACT domain-containing protein [unclassified Faecalibacterium]OUN40619.1 amino acid-binding protein [Faecalibacterium sp. An77]OUP27931.1 amino acid-binding protein [Faecalibacterium sp. An192]OUQ39400.1 amino acid-binding protein [Faecalibacterium sp. An122]